MDKKILKLKINYHWTRHLAALERNDEAEALKQFDLFKNYCDQYEKLNNSPKTTS